MAARNPTPPPPPPPAAGAARPNRPARGIACILIAMLAIGVNDSGIKALSGDYALHQIIFIRSVIGVAISLVLLQREGGFAALRTDRPFAHLARGLMIVAANLLFFTALAVMPLAQTTALFFVSPLIITLLSVPLLGERLGPWRLGAVGVGFLGMLVILGPEIVGGGGYGWVALLPVLSALGYAGMQIMTRRLGVAAPAAAMAIYVQATFVIVSLLFFAVAGDGRFVQSVSSDSWRFVLRAWAWPQTGDLTLFVLLGLASGTIGYCLSEAYRVAEAAVIAPFEYALLPIAIATGWLVFGEVPAPRVYLGITLIAGAGLVVFVRERQRALPAHARPPVRHG
ncbi:MAG: DMT family transporter [Pseudomonadota bacterium]